MSYHRCLGCGQLMLPTHLRHECANRACRSTFDEHLTPGSMPRTASGLLLTKTDVQHTIAALENLNRRHSAQASGALPGPHGRAIASTLRKLKAYLLVLEETPGEIAAESRSEFEEERMDIVERLKAREITEAEAQRLIAEVAERMAQQQGKK